VLFVFWVNLDGWFLLGPLTVALYALGHQLSDREFPQSEETDRTEKEESNSSGSARMPALLWLLAALGVLACLFNPNHIHVFQMPALPGFSAIAAMLQQDPLWRHQGMSPLTVNYLSPGGWLNPGALTYFALLILGPWSLIYNLPSRSLWGMLIWGVFALLSLYQAHMIPFFAVVAAPLTAMNFQEANLRRFGTVPHLRGPTRACSVAARLLTLVAALGLVVAAWPGWLQPVQFGGNEPRRWEVSVDESLREAAEQLAAWRAEKLLPEDVHGFHTSLDLANYCAWFGPAETTFLNSSLHGGPSVISDYLTVRRGLVTGELDPKPASVMKPKDLPRWSDIMRQRNIRYLVLHVGQRQMAEQSFKKRISDANEFPLVYLKGGVAIFAWNTKDHPIEKGPFANMGIDMNRLAFQAAAGPQAPLAPSPQVYPPELGWWEPFVRGHTGPSLKRDEADLYLYYFDAKIEATVRSGSEYRLWSVGHAGALIGDLTSPGPWPGSLSQLLLRAECLALLTAGQSDNTSSNQPTPGHQLFDLNYPSRDLGPAGALFLAIRAARQAIADDPYDAFAYMALGDGYYGLVKGTQERHWTKEFNWLYKLRYYQMITAYKAAARLQPDMVKAHERLAELYSLNHPGNSDLLLYPGDSDLLLDHLKPLFYYGEKTALAADSLTRAKYYPFLEGVYKQMRATEKIIQESENRFAIETGNLQTLDRAWLARDLGLLKRSLDVLTSTTDTVLLGKEGAALKLKLLLLTGQASKSVTWTGPELDRLQQALGSDSFFAYRALLAGVLGNYQEADFHLQKLLIEEDRSLPHDASINALRGALALEAGDIHLARKLFQKSLTIWRGLPTEAKPKQPLDYPGRRVAEGYLTTIEKYNKN
jgi:tetratricopeptide (TPR) repeat protein